MSDDHRNLSALPLQPSRVLKFGLNDRPSSEGRVFARLPVESEPFSVGLQGDLMQVWALCPPEIEEMEDVEFVVVNTGDTIPFPPLSIFLGTVTTTNGIVWHVWWAR